MDRDLIHSIVALTLASILLASGTILFSLAIDRTIGLRPTWPAVADEQTEAPRTPPPAGSYQDSLEQAPVDSNLRKLWESLRQEESASQLKFPLEIEEAMSPGGLGDV